MRSGLRRLLSLPRRRPWGTLGLVALGLLLGLGAVQGARYLRYRRHLRAAEEAIARYEFESARENLAECLKWRPEDPALLLLAARTARRAGLSDEAEDLLSRYNKRKGQPTPEGALERAMLQAQQGELPAVEDDLLAHVEAQHPDSNLILEALALGAVQVYQLNKAVGWLNQLLDRDPDNVTALINRGLLFESRGGPGVALPDYRRAVESQPENGHARLRLAQALLRDGHPAEAAEHFERAVQHQPHDPAALFGLATCRFQQNRRAEATRLLDDVLAIDPRNSEALRERGKLALAENNLADAEALLRRSLDVQPFDRETHYQLSLCLRRRGKQAAADKHLQRVKQIEADARQLEALYLQIVQKPHDPDPRVKAALICLRNGQEKEALRWLEGALQMAPSHRAAHRALADIYEHHGDKERARTQRRLAGDVFEAP